MNLNKERVPKIQSITIVESVQPWLPFLSAVPCFTLIERKEAGEEEEEEVIKLAACSPSPSPSLFLSLCAVTSSLLISSHFSPSLIRLNSFAAGLGRTH